MNRAEIDTLEFESLHNYFSCGNEIQVCGSNYKGINITWRTFFPWNIFKEPSDIFWLDLVLPLNTVIENGWMDSIYDPEGYGSPHFKQLEHAIEFINKYNDENN